VSASSARHPMIRTGRRCTRAIGFAVEIDLLHAPTSAVSVRLSVCGGPHCVLDGPVAVAISEVLLPGVARPVFATSRR
jgi:hypothetical protein